MNKPRDYNAGSRVGTVRAARTLSNIVNPPVIFAVLGLFLSLSELPFWPGLAWAAVYGFWVSLVPGLIVVYLLNSGRISDLHMNTQQERHIPYAASTLGSFVALLFVQIFGGPESLRCLSVYSLTALGLLWLINYFWLISIHTASVASGSIILALVFGVWTAVITIPILILICWARLYLRRHTVAQVFSGLIVGSLTVIMFAFIGCFV
jgi:membrane-associated phospholipid phosphatase